MVKSAYLCFPFAFYHYIFRTENQYFVGFYVLLLFDIVLCIQVENLEANQ